MCLTATAALAPIAYRLGLSQGGAAAASADGPALARAFIDRTDAIWDCEGFGDFPGLRTIDRAHDCGPAPATHRTRAAAPKPVRRGMLDSAALAAIAGDKFDLGVNRLLHLPAAPASENNSAPDEVGRGYGGVLPNILTIGAYPAGPTPAPQPPPQAAAPQDPVADAPADTPPNDNLAPTGPAASDAPPVQPVPSDPDPAEPSNPEPPATSDPTPPNAPKSAVEEKPKPAPEPDTEPPVLPDLPPVTVVPLPSALPLFFTGLAGLAALRRRKVR